METLFTGCRLIEKEQLNSTNTFAMELLRSADTLPEGTLIWAHSQVAGRGQAGNTWQSEGGKNLCFSIVWKPVFLSADQVFLLSQAVSLGLTDLLDQYLPGIQSEVKWPNDIHAGGKKVAGILIENIIRGKACAEAVVGVGLNVNQIDFPHLPLAGSMRTLIGKEFMLRELLEKLCGYLEGRYLQLRAGRFTEIQQDYLSRMMRYGILAKYREGEGIAFEGTITGIDESGRLRLRMPGGEIRSFGMREIVFEDL